MDRDLAAWWRRQLGAEPEAALAGAGFPCPRPLAGPAPLGRLAATAEELVPGGDLLAAAVRTRLAGLALPRWSATPTGSRRTSAQFLTAYEEARGRPWTAAERQACWAAGLWVRAFNAKKERLDGGGAQLDRLALEVGERAARAGLEVAGGA